LEGELRFELNDGRTFMLRPGMSFRLAMTLSRCVERQASFMPSADCPFDEASLHQTYCGARTT
jgi:hypothetical protein